MLRALTKSRRTRRNFEGDLFTEYFDMTTDPWQVRNIAEAAPKAEVAALRKRLHELWACKAKDCP